MTDAEQRRAAKAFVKRWKDKGHEITDTMTFWIDLLRTVYGVENAEHYITTQDAVKIAHTKRIDIRIPAAKVLVEQKTLGIKFDHKETQSDGIKLTPMEQAKRYADALPLSEHPRIIIACNFGAFQIYDAETQQTEILHLEELTQKYHMLSFLVAGRSANIMREMELSVKAGEIVGELYEEILKHYKNPTDDETLKNLNKLCVRLVFCLYAEDAGVFQKNQFHDYLKPVATGDLRKALLGLFDILDTKYEERDEYLEENLKNFPYVNGGLFAEKSEIPQLDETVKNLLIEKASQKFDWSGISPTIFGAVFESTLNPETRRKGGMHYTSIENIHKVIDPLFLNELNIELGNASATVDPKIRKRKLEEFQQKIASLKFLDPACGSGNFLTETYLSLRKLENEVLKNLNKNTSTYLASFNPIQVSISQFYGIEINDFAVSVAKTALWIAENQMMKVTEDIVQNDLNFLPLKSNTNIVEANALQIEWKSVIQKKDLNYIMGNPPFAGARVMEKEQKADVLAIFDNTKNAGNLDYVACWYKKAADMMRNSNIHTALVSTNSITQGEQVAILWKPLLRNGLRINFAHRTFRWDSESSSKAHVHCVIIGFSYGNKITPVLYSEDGSANEVKKISPYLIDASPVFIESRNSPICKVPEIGIGNKPIDKGNYLFTEEEKTAFIKKEPASASYFRRWFGAEEFINGTVRYCLWLGDCSPDTLLQMPKCLKRIQAVRAYRLDSKSKDTRILANKPTRFHVENMPKRNYIVIPETSSEKRIYTPMGFLSPDNLCSNALRLIPDATLYHFGILTSSVHMAWVRAVCGRLKSDYRYSKDIVYNNFPWCRPTDEQRSEIEKTAQAILDARKLYPDSSLADLYGEHMYLFPELQKAHEANDKAVMAAYGFDPTKTEPEVVAELMKLYKEKVRQLSRVRKRKKKQKNAS